MREQAFVRLLLFPVAGLLVWAAHFAAIYAINALACARGLARGTLAGLPAVPAAVTVMTLVAVAALAAIAWAAWIRHGPAPPSQVTPTTVRFIHLMAQSVVGLSLLGVLLDALPAYIVPPCG
jgi:hypothetical protein